MKEKRERKEKENLDPKVRPSRIVSGYSRIRLRVSYKKKKKNPMVALIPFIPSSLWHGRLPYSNCSGLTMLIPPSPSILRLPSPRL